MPAAQDLGRVGLDLRSAFGPRVSVFSLVFGSVHLFCFGSFFFWFGFSFVSVLFSFFVLFLVWFSSCLPLGFLVFSVFSFFVEGGGEVGAFFVTIPRVVK